MTELLFTKEK